MAKIKRRHPKPPQLKVKSRAREEVEGQKKLKKEQDDALRTEWLVHRCLLTDKNKVCTLANVRGSSIPQVLHEVIEKYFEDSDVQQEVSALFSMK